MKRLTLLIAPLALAAFANTAAAQSPAQSPQIEKSEKRERSNSINASPLGLLSGAYNINYERLSGSHGLLGEISFHNYSNSDADNRGAGAAIGYRWHWRGQQNSGFLGVNLGISAGTGQATITTNDVEKTFDVDSQVLALTGNVGRRWAWDNGLNITFRIGVGYGNYNITTDSDDPDAQEAVELVDDILTLLPVAFDGELSVGYNF